MLRFFYSFLIYTISMMVSFSVVFAEEGGYIGENPGIDFYSRIDTASDAHTTALIRKRLSKYPTFQGFGRDCRGSIRWLDTEKFDESLIMSLKGGDYSGLVGRANKKNVSIQGDSLVQLASCLIESYDAITLESIDEDTAISIVGNAGLYMDGSKENSDYDILADIEKINALIFSDPQKYTGVKNTTKNSYDAILRGDYTGIGLISATGGIGSGASTNLPSLSGSQNSGNGDRPTSPSIDLSTFGLGSTCSIVNGEIKITSIENLMDDEFQTELAGILRGDITNSDRENSGKNYGDPSLLNGNSGNTLSQSAGNDFFHTMPCDGIFCIKVKMNAGSMNALGGGQDLSIEGIIDRHMKIMNPISWSDLSQQKMTNNSFQLPFLNIKIKSKIAGLRTYMDTRPQEVRFDKKEVTADSKAIQFEKMKKCADVSAGLNSNATMSPLGYTYQSRYGVNANNIQKTTIPTNPQDLEANKLVGCLDLYLGSGNEKLHSSLGTDLIQLQAMSDALIQQIQSILNTGVKLDTLKAK